MAEGNNIQQQGAKKKRDRIGVILYAVYLLMLVASVGIFVKIIYIQLFFKPDPIVVKAITPQPVRHETDPARGNIIDSDGRLLAMTCPSYQIFMDCTVLKSEIQQKRDMDLKRAKSEDDKLRIKKKAEESEQEWLGKARELSVELARVFPEKSASEWYSTIREGRASGRKYLKIGKPVDRNIYNEILTFPLYREGRFKSGLIVERHFVRMYPYGTLARRTIGFVRDNSVQVRNTHIGLEGKFDHELHGTEGIEYLRVTDRGRMRDNDSVYVKPVNGKDLRTTLNIDYQDMADRALRNQISDKTDLEGACLVLMETSTGAIKAMVNLKRNAETGEYEETQNYAVGRRAEPGSVFKTVTLMSVLNDGYVKSLEETLPCTTGHVDGTDINDQHIPEFSRNHKGTKKISIIDGFKISSNYVFATLAVKNYGGKNAKRYIENIYSYGLGTSFDFDLDGLATPGIPSPNKKGVLHNNILGRVGFGYSTELTPLHVLTFYNGIANKGKMMKPYLVEDIEEHGYVSSKRGPSILNASICSKAVADTLSRALRAVTEDGTAKWSLMGCKCSVAGKTGTSFGSFGTGGYTGPDGTKKYQGTFVGYFPVEDPQYSVICMVYSEPTHNSYQGGGIPARAVKELINGIVNIDPYFQRRLTKAK